MEAYMVLRLDVFNDWVPATNFPESVRAGLIGIERLSHFDIARIGA